MSFVPDERAAVRTGAWLYDGAVRCRVLVVPSDVFPGTGDYEDPPDVAEDHDVPCFALWCEQPVAEARWCRGGWYLTLVGAVHHARWVCGPTLVWDTQRMVP